MSFRENLKSELTYQNILVKELSEKTKISKHTIDHYLAQDCISPSAENAVKIAQVLGVSVEYLITGRDGSVPDGVKPSVIALLKELNYLSESDIRLISEIAERLKK